MLIAPPSWISCISGLSVSVTLSVSASSLSAIAPVDCICNLVSGLVVPIPILPDESICNRAGPLVVSEIWKLPLLFLMLKSELLFVSFKNIFGSVEEILKSPSFISNNLLGSVLPIPTLPEEVILILSVLPPAVSIKFWFEVLISDLVDPFSLNLSSGVELVSSMTISASAPRTVSNLSGLVVPIPTLPEEVILIISATSLLAEELVVWFTWNAKYG